MLVNDLLAGVLSADGRGEQLLAELGVDLDELQQRLDAAPKFVAGF